jgi:hypothetical protein
MGLFAGHAKADARVIGQHCKHAHMIDLTLVPKEPSRPRSTCGRGLFRRTLPHSQDRAESLPGRSVEDCDTTGRFDIASPGTKLGRWVMKIVNH